MTYFKQLVVFVAILLALNFFLDLHISIIGSLVLSIAISFVMSRIRWAIGTKDQNHWGPSLNGCSGLKVSPIEWFKEPQVFSASWSSAAAWGLHLPNALLLGDGFICTPLTSLSLEWSSLSINAALGAARKSSKFIAIVLDYLSYFEYIFSVFLSSQTICGESAESDVGLFWEVISNRGDAYDLLFMQLQWMMHWWRTILPKLQLLQLVH